MQNILWNSYGCLLHFFFSMNYENYSLQYSIISGLYFANFSYFDLKLLYLIWRIKNLRIFSDIITLRRRLLMFYCLLYLTLFIHLYYVMEFSFEKNYIIFGVFMTWLPQIIFNTWENNRQVLPFVSILLYSGNKLFLPIYFRGYEANIFHTKIDYEFCLVIIGIQMLMVKI